MNTELSELQKEIIKASAELIAEKGIQGLTIKNIAKKNEIAESAIYRYYENKTQILIKLLDTINKHSAPESSLQVVDSVSSLQQKVRSLYQTFASFPAMVSVIFSEDLSRNEIPLIEKIKEIMQKRIPGMATIIKAGQENGKIRADIDSEHFAHIIPGTIRLFVKQWKMKDYSFNLLLSSSDKCNFSRRDKD